MKELKATPVETASPLIIHPDECAKYDDGARPVEIPSKFCPACGETASVIRQIHCLHVWHTQPLSPKPPTASEERNAELESQLTQVREELQQTKAKYERLRRNVMEESL